MSTTQKPTFTLKIVAEFDKMPSDDTLIDILDLIRGEGELVVATLDNPHPTCRDLKEENL